MLHWFEILKKCNSLGTIIIISVLITVMGLLSPIFIIHIFNRYITFGLEGTLYFLVLGAITVSTFEFFFRNLRNKIFNQITLKPIREYRLNVVAELFQRENINKDKFIESLDLNNNYRKFLSPQNQSNIFDSFFLIFIIIFLFFLSTKLSIIFVLILISYLLVQRKSNLNKKKIIKKNSIRTHDKEIIKELRYNFELLNYFNAYKYTNFFIENYFLKKEKNDSALSFLDNFQLSYNHYFLIVSSIIVIGIGSTFVVNGELSIGALIGFNIFSSRALITAASAQRSYFNLTLINELTLNYQEAFKDSENRSKGLQLNKITGNIEVKNIDYSYQDSNFFLLKNISINVSAGEILNISGKNGTGKTTLAHLILGLISPKSGEIFIDRTNLLKLSLVWWRQQVAYLPQNPQILNSSITDNILMANERLNQDEISRLLQTVGLDDSLKKSNLSLTDNIDPNLSCGIKKKIHYARLLAMNPQVFLIDDPLGNLDSLGKEMVLKLLLSLKKSQKTIITFSEDELIKKMVDNNIILEG